MTKAVVTQETEFELTRLEVIAGPETAAKLGVPVGTVVRTVTFDHDGNSVESGVQTETEE